MYAKLTNDQFRFVNYLKMTKQLMGLLVDTIYFYFGQFPIPNNFASTDHLTMCNTTLILASSQLLQILLWWATWQ